jgi:hypothetical protein
MAASPEDDYGRIVRLLMLTGQRRNEMGDMQHFPSESELGEVKMRWQQAQQVEMMALLSVGGGPKSSLVSGEGS